MDGVLSSTAQAVTDLFTGHLGYQLNRFIWIVMRFILNIWWISVFIIYMFLFSSTRHAFRIWTWNHHTNNQKLIQKEQGLEELHVSMSWLLSNQIQSMFQDIFECYQVLHIGKGVVIWFASFVMSANYVTINLFVCRILLLMLFSRFNSFSQFVLMAFFSYFQCTALKTKRVTKQTATNGARCTWKPIGLT